MNTNERGQIVDEETGEVLAQVFWKTPYNHDTNAESDRTGTACHDKSLADQSFKEEADINTIIDRLKRGAEIPVVLPEHFRADQRVDLFTARSRIAESNATFYNLDPEVRAEFLNDPGRWEQQVQKDLAIGNLKGLERMGIATGDFRTPEPPEPVQAATPAPDGTAPGGANPPTATK